VAKVFVIIVLLGELPGKVNEGHHSQWLCVAN